LISIFLFSAYQFVHVCDLIINKFDIFLPFLPVFRSGMGRKFEDIICLNFDLICIFFGPFRINILIESGKALLSTLRYLSVSGLVAGIFMVCRRTENYGEPSAINWHMSSHHMPPCSLLIQYVCWYDVVLWIQHQQINHIVSDLILFTEKME
jgi:hypothetical protein